ncbi:hypothetical protein H6A19_01465 [Clostridium saudiense]|uniref:Type 4 fimbrial biogenesis protein PilX N-terminal domain-containing protein n=1 Tax=Clostridium saudiense TaxID=1414720 RepID=A0ABS2FBV3_9CLOT|nr:hypothetical protein [Clostridium saudiense]MBM6818015.1 hypothetical protein [Clostridium saudiense]
MKKKGSSLMITMVLLLSLIIIGLAVSSAVINTLKYNKKHSEYIDLELAAKSGLNIFREELLSSINDSNGVSDLPVSFPKMKSSIDDFEGISIYKEIIRNEIEENNKLVRYDYTIISTAIDEESGAKKEQKQVISVNINSDSGVIEDVEISPEGVLNIKGNIEWQNNTYEFLKYTSYGGKLTNSSKGQLGDYLMNNNINRSEQAGNIDFSIVNDIDNKIDIGNFENIQKTTKSFSGLKEVTLQYLIDNNGNSINEDIILRGDLDLSQNYIQQYNLNLNGGTLVVEGDFVASGSLNVNLINSSNLVIYGDLKISQNGDIRINNSSFIDIKKDLIVNNGSLYSEVKEDSVLNIGEAIKSKSNGINLVLEDSKLDVNSYIESNGLNIKMNNSKLITRTGGIKGTPIKIEMNNSNLDIYSNIEAQSQGVDININNSKLIIRNDGISSPTNPLNLYGSNNKILVNGDLIGNGINITMDKGSKLVAGRLVSESNYVNLKLYNSQCLFNDGINANSSELFNDNSDVIFLGDSNIKSFNNYNVNGIVIFGGTYDGHTVTINLDNSMVFILSAINSDINGMYLENLLTVNNVNRGSIYILGNLKAHTINVTGNKDNIKATDEVISRAENLLSR